MTNRNGDKVSLSASNWLGIVALLLTHAGVGIGIWHKMDTTIQLLSQRVEFMSHEVADLKAQVAVLQSRKSP